MKISQKMIEKFIFVMSVADFEPKNEKREETYLKSTLTSDSHFAGPKIEAQ